MFTELFGNFFDFDGDGQTSMLELLGVAYCCGVFDTPKKATYRGR